MNNNSDDDEIVPQLKRQNAFSLQKPVSQIEFTDDDEIEEEVYRLIDKLIEEQEKIQLRLDTNK